MPSTLCQLWVTCQVLDLLNYIILHLFQNICSKLNKGLIAIGKSFSDACLKHTERQRSEKCSHEFACLLTESQILLYIQKDHWNRFRNGLGISPEHFLDQNTCAETQVMRTTSY